jgi:hypothetical protein
MTPQGLTDAGFRRAALLWRYLSDSLVALPAAQEWDAEADARLYRSTLRPVMEYVATHEFVEAPDGSRKPVLTITDESGPVQLVYACAPIWQVVVAIRGVKFRPAAEDLAGLVQKLFPKTSAAAAPPAEARNIVTAPAGYVSPASLLDTTPALESAPSVPRISAPKSEQVGNGGDWLQEYAETIATGDEALDAVLLKPLMHLPSDSERRRAMAAIRRGRETEAEIRRMRAESKTETRTDKTERAETFREIMARVQRMRVQAGENGATA